MATPVGHLLAASCLGAACLKSGAVSVKRPLVFLGILMAVSLAQDGDNLPHQLYGIDHWHREWTHSLVLAPAGGMAAALLWRWFCGVPVFRGWIWGTAAWAAHLGLDMLPAVVGPKLLLPWSDLRFSSPVHLLPVAEPHIGSLGYNLSVIVWEMLTFGGLFAAWHFRGGGRLLGILLLIVTTHGSGRQGAFVDAWMDYAGGTSPAPAKRRWYEQHLDRLTPWRFAVFLEDRPSDSTGATIWAP